LRASPFDSAVRSFYTVGRGKGGQTKNKYEGD
jgi:hypothetical protein